MRVLSEFDTSVRRALSEIDKNWEKYPGLIVCGGHSPKKEDAEQYIKEIEKARINDTPTLLICLGFQLGAIEYARNILGIKDATSEEWGEGTFVVKKRIGLQVGLHKGESFWSNYDVVIDWETPQNFFATPSHPEYQSSIDKPHPLLIDFLKYAKQK